MEEYNENIDNVLFTPALILLASVTTVAFVVNIALNDQLSFYSPFVVLAFLLGASMASFFAAMVERIPNGESTNTPSHCICGRNLKPWENTPVIGWLTLKLFHKGRTKCCDTKLPASYFLIESLAGFGFAGATIFFISTNNFDVFSIVTMFTAILTIIFLVTDYRNTIPNNENHPKEIFDNA